MTRSLRILHMTAATLLVLVAACDKDKKVNPVPVAKVVTNALVFTRSDSSVVEMGTTSFACCGLYDPSFVNERALRVLIYDPALQKSGWEFLILVDRLSQGATVTLPTVVVPPSKIPTVTLFVGDQANELNSDTQESSGTITVHSFSCDASSIRVSFSVDARLGSEFGDGPSMDVQGSFQAVFPAAACP